MTSRGRAYKYYAAPGCGRVRLPSLPDHHPEFLAAYLAAAKQAPKAPPTRAPQSGTLAALITAYLQSAEWKDLAAGTRRTRTGPLEGIRQRLGDAPARGVRERHIRAGLRMLEPNASNTLLRCWRSLCAFGVHHDWMDEDPSAGIKKRRVNTEGHHTWTPAEIAQARACLAYGSKARLALELAYWTAARRSDLVQLGRQMIDDDGWLTYRQTKTRRGDATDLVSIPFTAKLTGDLARLADDQGHLLEAMRTFSSGHLLFLETEYGRPHSVNGFGAWFKEHVQVRARLPEACTLHGLRKAREARLAELGWSPHRIGAWAGQKSLSEIQRYTRKADRRRMIERPDQEQGFGKQVLEFSKNADKSE